VPALAFDKDLDGGLDGFEDTHLNGIVDTGETSPLNSASDNDGLLDVEEDTNGDGVPEVDDPLLLQRTILNLQYKIHAFPC
jgi:hypothetical protein